MKVIFTCLLVLHLLGTPEQAVAFNLSPCLRVLTYKNDVPSQRRIRLVNLCGGLDEKYIEAVHEHMTVAAIKEYRGVSAEEPIAHGWKYQYMIEPEWTGPGGTRNHLTSGIVFGSWWNDDPLMRTWGQGENFLSGVFADYSFLKSGRPTYPGGTRNCNVPADEHLGRSSHFGRLQHLHFMTSLDGNKSSAKERVALTVDNAIRWIEFAYQVAIGSLKPDQQLSQNLQQWAGLPSIAKNHCVTNPENVKVRTVFSRIGHEEAYRNKITPDVALGSMLHLIQDSFSPAHTCRIDKVILGSNRAVLYDVFNYNEQDKNGHKSHDGYPEWLLVYLRDGRHLYDNDPIVVGSWLLRAVDEGVPWSRVESYLRETIFSADEGEGDYFVNMCIGMGGAASK